MDILKIVDDETPFKHEMRHPTTGEGMRVFVNVLSASNPKVKKALQASENKNRKRTSRGKIVTIEADEAQGIANISECIDSWDWSESDYDLDGDTSPECNAKNKKRFLMIADFAAQISEVSAEMENFTGKSKAAPKSTSKPI